MRDTEEEIVWRGFIEFDILAAKEFMEGELAVDILPNLLTGPGLALLLRVGGKENVGIPRVVRGGGCDQGTIAVLGGLIAGRPGTPLVRRGAEKGEGRRRVIAAVAMAVAGGTAGGGEGGEVGGSWGDFTLAGEEAMRVARDKVGGVEGILRFT